MNGKLGDWRIRGIDYYFACLCAEERERAFFSTRRGVGGVSGAFETKKKNGWG